MTDSITKIRSLKLSTHEFTNSEIVRAELMALNTVDIEIETNLYSDTISFTKADIKAMAEAVGFKVHDMDK